MKTRILAASALALLLSFSGMATAADTPLQPKPFDEVEFSRFLSDYPAVSKWVAEKGNRYGGQNSPWMLSGLRYDKDLQKHLQGAGWSAERFFYLLDHINLGLMTTQAELQQESMQQQFEKAQATRNEESKKRQAQFQEQQRSALESARAQWSAQRERVSNDPYLPPMQKQQILAHMDQNQPAVQGTGQQDRQRAWLNEQKQQITNNVFIPPVQKQAMLAQLDRSIEGMNPPKPVAPAKVDPAEQQAKIQAQHKQWLEDRMKEVRDNPMMPAAQKQQMLEQMQVSLKNAEKATQQVGKVQTGPLPVQEGQLIKSNRQKLTSLFFPEM
ncbi:MAG: hypothetical protein HQM04_02370 [Magnetococcales bacterium]|nr:hypothetical protein [Magnetococcales bacterium]MBF0113865.1 hypothetical protein [Magnetococcales bacterium]